MAKRKRGIPAFLHQPLYWAVRSLIGAMLVGDLGANLRTARAAGRAWASIEAKRVRRAMDNIAVAFPEMSEEQRHGAALQSYEHLFMLAVEMAYTPRLMTRDAWSDRVRVGNIAPGIRHLLSGRPCVLITGHCGNWELLGYTLALLGFPIHALYRPLDLAPMDRWLRQTRQRAGLVLVDKFGAARTIPRLMDRGSLVGFIADQNAGDRGLHVPFFNRLASTYKSIGLMAVHYDAPILCGGARRLVWERDRGEADADARELLETGHLGFASWTGEPFRYRIDINDIILPEEWKGRPDPLFYVTARYRRALERMVTAAPEQNLWLHRYWKSRPRHERLGRPMPPALREKIRALPWITDDDLARIEDWSVRDTRALAATA